MDNEKAQNIVKQILSPEESERFALLVSELERYSLPNYKFQEYNAELKQILSNNNVEIVTFYNTESRFHGLQISVIHDGKVIQ